MRRFPILSVLFVMLVFGSFAEACGPLRGLIQRVFRPFQQQQSCEPVFPNQSQIGPVQQVPQVMPQVAPVQQQAAPAKKTKIVWQQQCRNGVCTLVPVAVDDEEKVVATVSWDF